MNLRPYSAMKDSGVAWLGEVPEHWEVLPLKYWARMNDTVLPEDTNAHLEFDYLDLGSLGTDILAQNRNESGLGLRHLKPIINRALCRDRNGITDRGCRMIESTTGDILKADTECLANTINCVGIMGRGIALQFKKPTPIILSHTWPLANGKRCCLAKCLCMTPGN